MGTRVSESGESLKSTPFLDPHSADVAGCLALCLNWFLGGLTSVSPIYRTLHF